MHVAGPWIKQIKFFNCKDPEENRFFITELCLNLEPEAYAPKELIVYVYTRILFLCKPYTVRRW